MNKKKWTLLILFILLTAGYFKLFYKSWNNESVTRNADCIIALDVKRITNTLIWNFITSPSQWKTSNWFSSGKDGKVHWDNMISLPDYVFIFHRSGEPDNAFYTVVEINNKDDFEKGLKQYGFEKTATGSFISNEAGVEFIQNGNRLLIGNAGIDDRNYLQQTATALFNQKQFIDKTSLEKTVKANSHLALNGVLFNKTEWAGFYEIKGNFNDTSLYFTMPLTTAKVNPFISKEFSFCDTAMLSVGFTQPTKEFKNNLPLQRISKALNFNVDSLLLSSNNYYQLNISGIYPRIDSAITYTYDDNFNQIENIVVNKVEEPAFFFTVSGDSVNYIYDYWNRNGKLENNTGGSVFTPIPFAKSYCKVIDKNTLTVASAGYTAPLQNTTVTKGMFLRILISKVPPSLLNYVSPNAIKLLKNIETLDAFISDENGEKVITLQFNKKKNNLPLVEF
jgi:hypothetical protein